MKGNDWAPGISYKWKKKFIVLSNNDTRKPATSYQYGGPIAVSGLMLPWTTFINGRLTEQKEKEKRVN